MCERVAGAGQVGNGSVRITIVRTDWRPVRIMVVRTWWNLNSHASGGIHLIGIYLGGNKKKNGILVVSLYGKIIGHLRH